MEDASLPCPLGIFNRAWDMAVIPLQKKGRKEGGKEGRALHGRSLASVISGHM